MDVQVAVCMRQLNDNSRNPQHLFSLHLRACVSNQAHPTKAWAPSPALTLEGIRVSREKVLKLIAVGVNVVEGFSFYSKLVALLHLPRAAGWTLVLTNQQIHI